MKLLGHYPLSLKIAVPIPYWLNRSALLLLAEICIVHLPHWLNTMPFPYWLKPLAWAGEAYLADVSDSVVEWDT
jgi:hypothetical protein